MGTEYGYGYEKNLKPRIRKRYGNGIILKTWCGIRKVYGLILKAEYGIRKRYGPTSIYMYGYGIRIVIGTSEYGLISNFLVKFLVFLLGFSPWE